ncbi:hypothetical protein TNCV_700141 [Trichonephila clavipes]|nr:hypothetical protein TNCV_700141 [Trichonephila clavipes]
MVYSGEVWRSNWRIHSAYILPFQKFLHSMSFTCLTLSSFQIKPGPTAPVKKRTKGSKTSSLSNPSASIKDMEVCAAIQCDDCSDHQASAAEMSVFQRLEGR